MLLNYIRSLFLLIFLIFVNVAIEVLKQKKLKSKSYFFSSVSKIKISNFF